jgi:hypothetical protein
MRFTRMWSVLNSPASLFVLQSTKRWAREMKKSLRRGLWQWQKNRRDKKVIIYCEILFCFRASFLLWKSCKCEFILRWQKLLHRFGFHCIRKFLNYTYWGKSAWVWRCRNTAIIQLGICALFECWTW